MFSIAKKTHEVTQLNNNPSKIAFCQLIHSVNYENG